LTITRRTFRPSLEPVTAVDLPDVAGTDGETVASVATASSCDGDNVASLAIETPQDGPAELAGESVETAAPAVPATETPLDRARASLATTAAELGQIARARDAALLADDDVEVARLDDEIVRLQKVQRTLGDKVAVMVREAERVAAEQAVLAREEQILKVERLFVERDAAVADLRDHLDAAEVAYRRVHALGAEARAGWQWPHGTSGGTMTTGTDLFFATQSYLYKIGSRAGGADSDAGPRFPGGKSPRIEDMNQPGSLPDIVHQFQEASRHASNAMRGAKLDAAPVGGASPAFDGQSDAPVTERLPQTSPLRAKANPELAQVLSRMNALASRQMSEDDERLYQELGRKVQELSAA
jgi:hypothetical protein